MLAERHGPIAVKRAARVNAHRQGGDLEVLLPATEEEIAHGALHRGVLLAVPIDADDGVAPLARGSHPNVLDGARALDASNLQGLSSGNAHKRIHLPALAQVPGGILGRAVLQLAHGARALGPIEVFRTDGPGNRV